MNKMKRLGCLSLMMLALCASAQTGMSLKGEGENLKDGEKLYLYAGSRTPSDSTIVKNGKFEFALKGIEPRECSLVRPDGNPKASMLLYLDNCPTYVKIGKGTYNSFNTNFLEAEVSGNPTHTAVQEVNDLIFKAPQNVNPFESAELKEKMLKACERHDLAAAYVCDKYLSIFTYWGMLSKVGESIKQMSVDVRQSEPGRDLQKQYVELSKLETGATVENFTLNNREGKPVTLLEYVKGKKLVLIDFWASWCGPCRKEGVNVKAIYKDFHDKGFDVLGVSLDQKKEAWEKAIGEEGYAWEQVCDFKGFKSPVCETYRVTGIPELFLVDSNGKLVAKNLRGDDLRRKVAEYCK